MSASIWKVKTFSDSTVKLAAETFLACLRKEADYPTAVAFTAYHLEAVRQRGGGRLPVRLVDPHSGKVVVSDGGTQFEGMWAAAERSGHRYARGKNADNYNAAGCRLIALWIGRKAGDRLGAASVSFRTTLYDGDPTALYGLNDSLQEDGFPPLREWKP
jgi:hypothetical protein